jgi:hypothetical protein
VSDPELRALVRAVATEPVESRHLSPILPRLEMALQRAGLLGDLARLPDLGRTLREAWLTANDREWKSGENFQSFLTDEEFAEHQAAEPAEVGRERPFDPHRGEE